MKLRYLGILPILTSLIAYAASYEYPSTFRAQDVVPEKLLQGPNHKVLPEVTNDGIQNHFILAGDFGELAADGMLELRIRIREADAFAYLEAMSKTKVFVESLADAGIGTAKSIMVAFSNPIQTVQGLPGGVVRMFSGYVTGARRGAAGAQRMIDDSAEDMDPAEFKKLNYLVSGSEREWASKLKIDPYTTNLKLRSAVRAMAVVQFIGGLPVDFALPMTASVAVNVLSEVGSKVYEQDAPALEISNRSCLAENGISDKTIEAFFASNYLTPTSHTVFCASLTRLNGVDNLDFLALQLSETTSFDETRFLLGTIGLLTWHQTQYNNIERISSNARMPYGVTQENEFVVMVPADFLIWSELLEQNLSDHESGENPFSGKSFWTTGTLSDQAKRELVALGWKIHDRTSDPQMMKLYEVGITTAEPSTMNRRDEQ